MCTFGPRTPEGKKCEILGVRRRRVPRREVRGRGRGPAEGGLAEEGPADTHAQNTQHTHTTTHTQKTHNTPTQRTHLKKWSESNLA